MPEFLSYFRTLTDRIEDATEEAEREIMRRALAEARRISSGPYSTRTLRRMGHPYSRRRPHPPLSAYHINVQTGRFRAGWRVVGPIKRSEGIAAALVNESAHAGFLRLGTTRMIPRPFERHMRDFIEGAENQRLVEAMLAGALRG